MANKVENMVNVLRQWQGIGQQITTDRFGRNNDTHGEE